MLFNSYAFILGFMPLTLLLFHGLRVAGLARSSIGLLALLSNRAIPSTMPSTVRGIITNTRVP